MQSSLPPGISIVNAEHLEEWQMDIRVLDDSNPLYLNETYRLKFTFTKNYPIGTIHPTNLPLSSFTNHISSPNDNAPSLR
ncbi:hypothetical protein ACJ72_08689 [Emergomyces africanus]|uniref:UBC core domain-containing protein n=1 Tax=Emergomyces africanus TaxID=1955775 RepID=A0A1B7NK82_9EURO|nr:hypothetical protein ACJ72_08689 [Emergomyces africanus]